MAATSFNRKYLDKNGCNRLNSSYDDFTWAGAATTMNWTYNYGTNTVGAWSPAMKKKFTPKTIKRRGWRE